MLSCDGAHMATAHFLRALSIVMAYWSSRRWKTLTLADTFAALSTQHPGRPLIRRLLAWTSENVSRHWSKVVAYNFFQQRNLKSTHQSRSSPRENPQEYVAGYLESPTLGSRGRDAMDGHCRKEHTMTDAAFSRSRKRSRYTLTITSARSTILKQESRQCRSRLILE